MTNDSKENLLKILVNETEESPGEDKSSFTIKEVSAEATNDPLSFDQLEWQGYTIGLNGQYGSSGGYIYLYDQEGNLAMKKKPLYKGTEVEVIAMDIDENGDMYGLFVYDNLIYLGYFYNPFVKNADGEYDVVLKIDYNLQPMYTEIFNELGVAKGSVYNSDIKKSANSGEFLITRTFGTTGGVFTLIVVKYTVNVGSSNSYEYRSANIGNNEYNWIKSVRVNWNSDSTPFTMLVTSSDFTNTPTNCEFYKVTGDFSNGSSITSTLILDQDNYKRTAFIGLGASYTSSKDAVQTEDSIYFASNEVDGDNLITTIYRYKTSLEKVWEYEGYNLFTNSGSVNIIKCNNQIFAWTLVENIADENHHWNFYFLHIVGGDYNEMLVKENTAYSLGIVGIIQNYFNLYIAYIKCRNYNSQEIIKYTYNPSNYNGQPYFSKKSVTSNNLQLFNGTGEIIFDRNLYNKTLVGNSVNSVTQVPYNYLNNEPIIKEDLLSKNNNIIDSDNKEINKNMYEELYITNIDAYKVFDNNNGSVYNQNSSLEVAKNVFNGFEGNYKITKYKVNFSDGTSQVNSITEMTRTNNVATLTIYIYNTGVDSIELYDDSLTIPFIKIDMSNKPTERYYMIKQKVKVE